VPPVLALRNTVDDRAANSEFVGDLLPCLATSQEIDDLADLIVSQCSPTVFLAA
jgi:hypothetical protein